MKKICIHWTAGNLEPSEYDLSHYHVVVGDKVYDHKIKSVMKPPEVNNNCYDGDYVAHCGWGNTGTIGIAIAGYKDNKTLPAKETFELFFETIAIYCLLYDLEVDEQTVYTHAEFEQRLKPHQRSGKIDINYLPYYDIEGVDECGQFIRSKVKLYKEKQMKVDKQKVAQLAEKYVPLAENIFKEEEKSGKEKFIMVLGLIVAKVPLPFYLKPFRPLLIILFETIVREIEEHVLKIKEKKDASAEV